MGIIKIINTVILFVVILSFFLASCSTKIKNSENEISNKQQSSAGNPVQNSELSKEVSIYSNSKSINSSKNSSSEGIESKLESSQVNAPTQLIKTKDIHIRDPYILLVEEEKAYYMFGTTGSIFSPDKMGFMCYRSKDLENWEGPFDAFNSGKNNIAFKYQDYWAPEVYHYNGKYYMFATLGPKDEYRRSQVLIADRPEGPYTIKGTLTPKDWGCLDASLYIEDGIPYAIFCKQWIDIGDGEMYYVKLSDDLLKPVGSPELLFKASSYPQSAALTWENGITGYITDAPFMYKSRYNQLFMLWSTFTTFTNENKYALVCAKSTGGKLSGPWIHVSPPIEAADGGHAMVFKDYSGISKLIMHLPNTTGLERPYICGLDDSYKNSLIKLR